MTKTSFAAGLPSIYPSASKAVVILRLLEVEVDRAVSLDEINEIATMAKAIQTAKRDVKDVSDRAGRVRVKAERKLGAKLAEFPKAKGKAGPGRGKAGVKAGPAFNDSPSLKDIGVDKKRSAQSQKLAEIPEERLEKVFADLCSQDTTISPSAVLQAERKRAKVEKKHAVATAVFSANGPFGTVVIDPPWQMEKIDRDVRPNQDVFDYPTMSVSEITGFFNADIQPKIESDCHLFMWTTHKWLPASLAVLDSIGFKYVLTMVWRKNGGFQPIGLPQYNCEFVIYARKGNPIFIDTKDFPCCFDGERREHSRKPERFYEIVGRVTGGSRIDVFSREQRDGFAQFGNEIGKFTEAA